MGRLSPLKKGLGGAAVLLTAFAVAVWKVPLPQRLQEVPSRVVEYRDGSPAHVFVSADGRWRPPVQLKRVDPAYVHALIALEDQRFYDHAGVDPLAVVRAFWTNLRQGRRVSGGSTLTMQLVRLLEPRPRQWSSKVLEAFRATQLELRKSKTDILQAYLQFVPYGKNLEGIESGALAYFGHTAQHLSPAEIATLLAVPQSPSKRAPSLSTQTSLREARNKIAKRLLEVGAFPQRENGSAALTLEEVLNAPVPVQWRAFPREAAHIAYAFRSHSPEEPRIATTLDSGLQHLAEDVLAQHRTLAATEGIFNGAVLLVDHHSAEVVAAVGNMDFWENEHSGQVSALHARRSPGSALKPFLYAMAVSEGRASSDWLMPDLPVQFGTWNPKNFDGQFRGLVRLDDALSRSLNVPFVHLLQQTGVERFMALLRTGGVRHLSTAPGQYGLSAVVGGVELTPIDLAGLYVALAHDGVFRPLQWTVAETSPPREPPISLFPAGAAWLTRQALSLRDRPDFPERRALTAMPPNIHWKTGTSFGFRDAWAAGSTHRYTAVVWMGNLDNQGSVALTGAKMAAPILFDLLEAVDTRAGRVLVRADVPPPDLTTVQVCAFSGHLPTEACHHTRPVHVLRSAVPTERCPFHVHREVDLATRLSVTPACRGSRRTQRRTYVAWPASWKRFHPQAGLPLEEPPPYASDCLASSPAKPQSLSIVSPPAGQKALLVPGVPAHRQEVPLEADSLGAGKLSWFINGEFLGTVSPEETVWWVPQLGTHRVTVADETGHTVARIFEVAVRPQ